MENYESILKFEGYMVNEVYFKKNEKFKNNNEGTPIDIQILPKVNIKKDNMNIILNTEIFTNAIEKNYPFEMKVRITGKFIIKEELAQRFVKNAIAILYPYVRAIISTYTASANINPLILPAINVNKLIEDQLKKD